MEQYASAGGVVVVAAGNVGPGETTLTGVEPTGELRAVRAWKWLMPTARKASGGS